MGKPAAKLGVTPIALRPFDAVVNRMPDFMKGVINLRGAVVPVVDMRLPREKWMEAAWG